jgi:hypothetical protein
MHGAVPSLPHTPSCRDAQVSTGTLHVRRGSNKKMKKKIHSEELPKYYGYDGRCKGQAIQHDPGRGRAGDNGLKVKLCLCT